MIKRMMNLWRKWCAMRHHRHEQMENRQAIETPVEIAIETSEKTTGNKLSVKLEKFLTTHYEFRYNVLTEQAEVRMKGKKKFRPVNQRVANTLCLAAQEEGIACWDKDVMRYLNSERLPDFHPLLTYMAELPEWDGIDRVTPLAERISTMDVGRSCPMVGTDESMRQLLGSDTHQHLPRDGKEHVLPSVDARLVGGLLYGQLRPQ